MVAFEFGNFIVLVVPVVFEDRSKFNSFVASVASFIIAVAVENGAEPPPVPALSCATFLTKLSTFFISGIDKLSAPDGPVKDGCAVYFPRPLK